MRKLFVTSIILTTIATMTSCGGGSSPTSAEGVYSGTFAGSADSEFKFLVLENDEYWFFDISAYQPFLCGTGCTSRIIVGLYQGQGTSNNGTFTSSNVKSFSTGPSATGTATATYVPRQSVRGSLIMTDGTVSFSGSPLSSTAFSYGAAATVSTIAGGWTFYDRTASSYEDLNIDQNGRFSFGGCPSFSGTFTPRPTGKNVFNVTLINEQSSICSTPPDTYSGIAFSYLDSDNTTRRLIFSAVNATRSASITFIAQK